MTNRIAVCCLIASFTPAALAAQPAAPVAAERLSIETAIRLALDNNTQLQAARLEIENAEDEVAIARLRRLPAFQTELAASQLLTPVGFSFPKGAFGDFPATGPIPAVDTSVNVPRQPTYYVSSRVSQPLSQLVQINLGIRSAATSREIERERTRSAGLSVVNAVKKLYFAILQTESALRAGDEAIALYRELDRTLQVRVVQRVALQADAFDVQYRLAQEELSQTTRENTLASQKEQMNQLLGRDLRTVFDVDPLSALTEIDVDLEAAQKRALASRPDVREAQLGLQHAEISRQLVKADRLPDVSLAVSYSSNVNIDVLPSNVTTFGIQVTWEPFDWGRKGRELAVKTRTVQQARLAVRDAEDRAVLEINSKHRTLAEKRALLNVAQMAQRTSREKLRMKTAQYQVQAALLPDVLQLRAELADRDDRYQQALLGFWTAKADFEQAIGEE
jgi:outer membrane protein TolC